MSEEVENGLEVWWDYSPVWLWANEYPTVRDRARGFEGVLPGMDGHFSYPSGKCGEQHDPEEGPRQYENDHHDCLVHAVSPRARCGSWLGVSSRCSSSTGEKP